VSSSRKTPSRSRTSTCDPRRRLRAGTRVALGWVIAALLAGCTSGPTERAYVPDVGEIMMFTQLRHAKLWWAGEAGNWPLAAYETGELAAGFGDLASYHPTIVGASAPLASLLPLVDAPLDALRGAIHRGDRAAFATAFDALTQGCNACHRATQHPFIVIERPHAGSVANQNFAGPKPE